MFVTVLKDFTDQKRDEKMYKKSSDISVYNTINREEVRKIEVVVGTLCIMYQRRLQFS